MKRQYVILLILAVVLIGTRPVEARMPNSCWTKYQGFLNTSWNQLEACFQETNSAPWYSRLGTRMLCKANWMSNAWQGELDYISCMSMLEKVLGK